MNIREETEMREKQLLSPYASCSENSKGRERLEEECDIRTVYQRDRDRIVHCKAFRRLKDKTQVFLSPQGDHYRNRLTQNLGSIADCQNHCQGTFFKRGFDRGNCFTTIS